MSYGVQIMSSTGALLWDSTTAVGGIVVDFKEFAAGATGGTFSYTAWAGYTAFLIPSSNYSTGSGLVTLDTSAGYPVVTVATSSLYRAYALGVY